MGNKYKRTILITGVSSGIGKVLAKRLSASGNFFVIGLSRSNSLAESNNYKFFRLDLGGNVQNQLARKELANYRPDFFINNAGSAHKGTIDDLSMKEIHEDFAVNYFGSLQLIKELLPTFYKSHTEIINISALGIFFKTPTIGIYSSTKLAMHKTLEIMSMETGIKVHHLYLGAVKSAFGKNMKSTSSPSTSKYSKVYSEWNNRFRSYFKNSMATEDVAKQIEIMIYTKKYKYFLTWRDWLIANICCKLPSISEALINYFYKNET